MITPKQLEISPCNVSLVKNFIETYHYSKSINGVKISQCFSISANNELIGAVLFGGMSTTAWKKFGQNESEVLELRRLVLLDKAGKNCESRVIGYAIRWIRKNLKQYKIVVSYADPNHGHTGVIYRASNFKYLGTSALDKGFKDTETGKIYHSRALRTKYKGDYKPFVKKLRAKKELGLLEEVTLIGKHCFVYYL